MFRTVPLSISRGLFTVHSAMVYVIQVCRQLSNRTRMERSSILVLLESCLQTCMTYTIYPWWWTEELSETCRVPCQNKFVKLVHLVGFIIKKFVTMHGHMNVKYSSISKSRPVILQFVAHIYGALHKRCIQRVLWYERAVCFPSFYFCYTPVALPSSSIPSELHN